jgi:hypothetical protein
MHSSSAKAKGLPDPEDCNQASYILIGHCCVVPPESFDGRGNK